MHSRNIYLGIIAVLLVVVSFMAFKPQPQETDSTLETLTATDTTKENHSSSTAIDASDYGFTFTAPDKLSNITVIKDSEFISFSINTPNNELNSMFMVITRGLTSSGRGAFWGDIAYKIEEAGQPEEVCTSILNDSVRFAEWATSCEYKTHSSNVRYYVLNGAYQSFGPAKDNVTVYILPAPIGEQWIVVSDERVIDNAEQLGITKSEARTIVKDIVDSIKF